MKRRFSISIWIVLMAAMAVLSLVSCDIGKKKAIDLSGNSIEISFFGNSEFEYKGFEIKPNLRVMDGYDIIEEYYDGVPNENIVVEYENNIEVGTATVTVTPGKSGKYTGKAVAHFEIVASSAKAEASDFESLKGYLAGGGYADISVTADITVPEGESLTVSKGVSVDMNGHALINNGIFENNGEINFKEYGEGNSFINDGTFKNNGKILFYAPSANAVAFVNDGNLENAGEIYLNGNKEGELSAENNGEIKNGGNVYLNTYSDFFNYGGFENTGNVRVSGEAKFYTNSDVSGNDFIGLVRRYPIEEFKIYLSDEAVEYCGSEIRPAIIFEKEGYHVDYGDYEATFENNVNVGTATVKIVATKDSDAFFGETALTFEIKKGSVTVTDREGFYSAIVNPNYEMIYLNTTDKFGTFFNEGFTVPEGLSLTIFAECDEGLYGNVVNNGIITVLNGYGLRVYGSLVNNGEISSKQIVNRGTLENNGVISLGAGKSYSGNMTNAGEISVDEGGTFYVGGDTDEIKEFVNDGSVTSQGTVYVNHTLTNNGTFKNLGELYVFSTGNVNATKAVENGGNVYLNEESDAFVGGNVTVKEEIQASDIEITNLPFVYDGTEKKAAVRIAGGISDRYDVTYLQGVTEIDHNPLDAGNYSLKVTFREDSRAFKGSATVEFKVGRAEKSVNAYADLVAALDDFNYNKVIWNSTYIKGDLEIPTGYVLVIPKGGSLINKEYAVEVNGSVENNGEYVNDIPVATLTVNDGGSFVNNGSCYFNDVAPAGVNGDGTVYVREDIAGATVLTLSETEVIYEGYNTETPDYSLTTLDGETITGEGWSYCTNYNVISTPGDMAKLTVKANETSTEYYGEISAEYAVLPGETTVSTFQELKAALGNVKEGTQLCNFGKVSLTADIDVEGNRTEQTLVVPENVTLVLGDYVLDLRPDGTFDKDVFLENNGVIQMTSHNIDCSKTTGSGKYVGYASTASAFSSLMGMDEIYLTADISEEVTLYANTSTTGTCVIDTCGYDIRRITVKMQGRKSFIVKSSAQGSVIGGAQYTDCGIYCQEIDEKATLTLVNLTVYGIEYNYLASEERVVIDASCNVIS